MSTQKISAEGIPAPVQIRPSQARPGDVDAAGLERVLRRNVEGEVRFDPGTKALYAVDASNYRHVPIGVVVPRTIDDVVATVAVCRQFGAPVLSRAGGTSLAGQCCNVAIVIDWSKYLNRIVELNPKHRYARVQPGCICDDLVDAAKPYKLTYAPDPATHDHCCFGGMLGNNSCGAHAQIHGAASNNTEELDVLLYDGTRMRVGWMNEMELETAIRKGGREGDIYAKLKSLRLRYQDLIQQRYPKIPRRISGYNLDQLIPDEQGRFNVARALVGTEGTCVTFLECKVELVYSHPERVLLLLGYPDAYHAGDHIMDILGFEPIGLEGMDARLIHNIQKKGGEHERYLRLLPEGNGLLMVEFGFDTQEEAAARARELMDQMKKLPNPPTMKLLIDKQEQKDVWKVRESGLGATAFVPGQPDTWPGWEDSAVSPEKVGPYLRDLRKLFERYGYNPALYGHFGQGCIHCRIDFDLMSRPGIDKFRSFMNDAADLVVSYGGSLSGEHGDGQSRAELLPKMFGEELVQAFREFKSIWDPDGKMNPGKVVDPHRLDEDLRLGATYRPWDPPTHFKFPQDNGSFAHAALRCVGVGKCRRMDSGSENQTMCPSFMVTREEKHTTRGRAHALWEMLQGDVIADGWRDENVKETLDLCLSCKGCKGDCPVNVDMATYKAEFLSHYWEGRLRPRYAYAFGLIDQWARMASYAPGFANLFTQLPGLAFVAKKAAGMPRQRTIPAFAAKTFQSWFRQREPRNAGGPKVVLWPDTFNNYFFPETAQAAVEVLESAGFQVEVPSKHVCCGRPLYDYGFLKLARQYLERNLEVLRPHIEAGTPVVALEPSCCSVFRDELHGLMPDNAEANRLVSQTFTLGEFLDRKANGYRPPKLKREALVHGHCHHKAIMRMHSEKKLLKEMEVEARELNSGCCGMAGSFGYEADKYAVSIACGERVLLPEVRKAGLSTLLIADGFSCKEQISQQTNRHGLHMAEVIYLAQKYGPHGPGGIYPENHLVKPRQEAVKRSMKRAGLITAATLAAGLLSAWLWRRR